MTTIGPLQHDEVDVGERLPVRCLRNGLWLPHQHGLPFAVLVGRSVHFGQVACVHVEVAVPAGKRGLTASQDLFTELERHVGTGQTYGGRVISLERLQDPFGREGAVKVHRLPTVNRDDLILPDQTLALLDTNISRFAAARDRIKALRFSGKKDLLFYGSPGTGKTHTIHYLVSHLPAQTTLLDHGRTGSVDRRVLPARPVSPTGGAGR